MKIAVVLLVVFGLIAAMSASMLLQMYSSRTSARVIEERGEQQVTLLLATGPLPAMTVITGSHVITKEVPQSQVPEGALLNSVQVVGKVLTRPMVEGEVFGRSSFAQSSSGLYLASALPEGKRAVTVAFRDHTAMAGILYPGSVVDVLVTLQASTGAQSREAVSTTLLQGLQVLAIGTQTVVAEQEFEDRNPGALSQQGQINVRNVTLLVTPKQAELLQLAEQHGNVSLALRNPIDTEPVRHEGTRMSEVTDGSRGRQETGTALAAMAAAFMKNIEQARAERPTAPAPAADPFDGAAAAKPKPAPSNWEMMIVRGTTAETRSFPMPIANGVAAANGGGVAVDAAPSRLAAEPVVPNDPRPAVDYVTH
jgi:pilus assembly protein CpaB